MGCMNIRFVRVHDSPTLFSVFLHSPKKFESCLLQCQILQSKVLCWSEVCSILILAPSKSYEDAQGHIDILSFVVEQSTMRKITNLRYGEKQKIHDYHCLFFSPKSTKC